MFNTLKEVAVGSAVSVEATFLLPLSINLTNSVAKYVLQDDSGVEYLNGNASTLTIVEESTRKKAVASGGFTIPSTLPVSKKGQQYQIMWTIESNDGIILSTYVEMIVVTPNSYDVFGIPDVVEIATDVCTLEAILPVDDVVDIQLYGNNGLLYQVDDIAKTSDVVNGFLYKHQVTTLAARKIIPSLYPYTVLWKYPNGGQDTVEDGYLYLITPGILSAAKDLQNKVNAARSSARAESLDIDLNVLINFLKLGMDKFNATGMPTYFTMTNCQGPIRSYWVACSEVELLRSQFLKEAERSFNLQGQSVTLDIDMTTYYEQAASSVQGWIDQYIPDFKRNLNRRGITTGDGNLMDPRSRHQGSLGISSSPVSNHFSFYSQRFGRFR